MNGKLILFLTGTLATSWSHFGYAACTLNDKGQGIYDASVLLRQSSVGVNLSTYSVPGNTTVVCDSEGGWFELTAASPFSPVSGSAVVKTNIDFIGVSITADLLNEGDPSSGQSTTVLTDGSFTHRRWVVPKLDDANAPPRSYSPVNNARYEFWATGPEDPKSGLFGASSMITLTTGDNDGKTSAPTTIYGFGGNARAIASCSIDSSALNFIMPETKTTALKQNGILEASKVTLTTSTGIRCDRDVNARFTLNATSTVAGLPNVLAPEPGGAEGVGAAFRYEFGDDSNSGRSGERDVTLGQSFDLLNGPVGHVRKGWLNLNAYYYRYGSTVKAGHFRSTAILNVQIQ